jgi:hypothetical protein
MTDTVIPRHHDTTVDTTIPKKILTSILFRILLVDSLSSFVRECQYNAVFEML